MSVLLENSDYFAHKDIKGKVSFSKSGESTPLFRCEETKSDKCLLFDKDGEYLDVVTTPNKCYEIKNNYFCPIPKEETKEDSKEPKKETKEDKIKEVVAKVDKKETTTLKEKINNWWKGD